MKDADPCPHLDSVRANMPKRCASSPSRERSGARGRDSEARQNDQRRTVVRTVVGAVRQASCPQEPMPVAVCLAMPYSPGVPLLDYPPTTTDDDKRILCSREIMVDDVRLLAAAASTHSVGCLPPYLSRGEVGL